MIDLRYIMGRQDALAECAVRIKSGGAERIMTYIEEQLGMCRAAETEILTDMAGEDEIKQDRRMA
jgi:hypothetical protein